MEQIHDLLEYENLKIYQNNDWFSFSLDSVLLAHYATVPIRTYHILDLCTGNAPIPLILSRRTKAHIDAVEIQKDVATLAQKSVEINHLEMQITVIPQSAQEFQKSCESDTYDLITCNPPYFKDIPDTTKNLDIHKTLARHEVTITLEEILKIVRKLLKNNGTFAIVHRAERLPELLSLFEKYNITPKRLRLIYPHLDREANMLILEGTKNGHPGLKILSPILVHKDDGSYTDEILEIFKGRDTNESEKLSG